MIGLGSDKNIIPACIFIDLFFGLGTFSLIGVSLVGYFYWSMLYIPVKNSRANKEIGDCSHDQTQRSHILLLHNKSTEDNQSSADTLLFLKVSKTYSTCAPSARCLDCCRRQCREVLRIVYRHHIPSLVKTFFLVAALSLLSVATTTKSSKASRTPAGPCDCLPESSCQSLQSVIFNILKLAKYILYSSSTT